MFAALPSTEVEKRTTIAMNMSVRIDAFLRLRELVVLVPSDKGLLEQALKGEDIIDCVGAVCLCWLLSYAPVPSFLQTCICHSFATRALCLLPRCLQFSSWSTVWWSCIASTLLQRISMPLSTLDRYCPMCCAVILSPVLSLVPDVQLAIHLRNAIMNKTKDAHKTVYNWQYINCLRAWAHVLASLGSSKGMGGRICC